MFPLKIYLQKKRDVPADPDKYKDVDEEKYQLHLAAFYLNQEVVAETYYIEGYALALIRSIYTRDSVVNVDSLLCVDLDGNVTAVDAESIKVDIKSVEELHRKQFK